MCELIREGRWTLIHPDMGVAAKLAAIEELFNRYAPPPSGFPGSGEGRAGGSTTGLDDTPARHARSPLFTDWAASVTGEKIRAWVTSVAEVPADSYPELQPQLSGEHTATRREGLLITESGRPVAEVTAVYLHGRMPDAATVRLRQGIPLGQSLAPDVRRQPLEPDGIRTRGLLLIPGPDGEWPVAVASELLLT
jgi:antitoxin (DNA-binding transcriptional repressor) of toxin-antitoxin stability system